MAIALLLFTLLFTLLPVAMFLKNRGLFHRATINERYIAAARDTWVSVCIPARNEEESIAQALDCLCESTHPKLEVLVLDDHSEDRTRYIAESFGIKVLVSEPLPDGWNGKQFACWQLANHATHSRLIFMDADVRLSPDAIERLVAEQLVSQVSLLSGFPRQVTGTLWEKILIPMMHYLLLCYLPIDRMRSSSSPAFSAGCGQLFVTTKKDYMLCGGHQSIASSRHDGIQLPKAYRRKGLKTDIIDASDLATCRMYRSARSVLNGLLKNADEGIANPRLIFLFTVLLGMGNIAPWVLLCIGLMYGWSPWITVPALLLGLLSYLPRLLAAQQFRQSSLGVVLHPISIVVFLALQWVAFTLKILGRQVLWRGRH